MTNKLLRRPSSKSDANLKNRFEHFNLSENPFPSDPFVNKDSMDRRINGAIFEMSIRLREFEKFTDNFIKKSLSDPNHIRLGYLIEDSYVGRGNGKSAFLINLQQSINNEFGLDISNGLNKCFAVYFLPEAGGRTKTFGSFVDQLYEAIRDLDIIKDSIASLVFEGVMELYPGFDLNLALRDDPNLFDRFLDKNWIKEQGFHLENILDSVRKNAFLQSLPPEFPLLNTTNSLFRYLPGQEDFDEYYQGLKKGKDRYNFVFSHLVQLFQAAGFNGAFVLIDDFEKILDFQSSRQKKDFALELRQCIYDGFYINSRSGFFNFLLVIHAGVQNIISEAWSASGLDNRAAIAPKIDSAHIIKFEKLNTEHAEALIKKYLSEYRNSDEDRDLFPFESGAVKLISEMSELVASKILKTCYYLLDKASEANDIDMISEEFVRESEEINGSGSEKKSISIEDVEPENLLEKVRNR